MLLFVLALLVLVVGYAVIASTGRDKQMAGLHADALKRAKAGEASAVNRALLDLAGPLTGLKVAKLDEESPVYKKLRTRLAASGYLYGGQVEILIATTMACAFLASAAFAALLAFDVRGIVLAVGILGGVGLTAYPYNRVSEAARERTEQVDNGLPEFAELLLMPLSSGYGILSALEFTAKRVEGPVAEEVRAMLTAIHNRSRTEAQAFADASERLGTPSALSFFNALSQAHLEGTRVMETIRSQAVQLRKTAYERTREKLKKMPNKMALIMGVHLMPTLMVIMMFPTVPALGSL